MTTRIVVLKVLCAALWVASSAHAQTSVVNDSNLLFGERTSPEQLHSYVKQLSGEHAIMTQRLMQACKESRDDRKTASLAYLLGEYRVVEAVPILIERITVQVPDPDADERITVQVPDPDADERRISRWLNYPAQEAIRKIGGAAIPHLLKCVRTSEDAKARELAIEVIPQIEEDSLGQVMARNLVGTLLDSEIEKSRDATQNKHLAEAKLWLAKHPAQQVQR